MKSQRECVYSIVSSVIGLTESVEPPKLTSDQRADCLKLIVADIADEKVIVSDAKRLKMGGDEKEYKTYAQNILTNWVTKDPRWRNGETYKTKNPGSRAGSGDKALKELKKLLTDNPTHADEINKAIETRLEAIKATKPKAEIDFSLIPEFAHLKAE